MKLILLVLLAAVVSGCALRVQVRDCQEIKGKSGELNCEYIQKL